MPTLEPDELDSLMTAFGRRTGRDEALYAPLDLTNPERNVPEPMPKLESICQSIGHKLGILVSAMTSKSVEARFAGLSRARFKDLLAEEGGAIFGVMELGRGDRPALVLVPAMLAERLLAATLGGRDGERSPFDPAAPTLVELAVLRRLLTSLEGPLESSFAEVLPMRPRLVQLSGDPRLAGVFTNEEVAIVAPFALHGELDGDLRVALPYNTLDEAREMLVVPRRALPAPTRWDALAEQMEQVELQLIVELGRGWLSCADSERLAEGDVLLLDSEESRPLDVTLGGQRKLEVRPEVRGSRIVAVVERVLAPGPLQRGRRGVIARRPTTPIDLVGTRVADDGATRARAPTSAGRQSEPGPQEA
jgi:flagellar motor switch protein FliM